MHIKMSVLHLISCGYAQITQYSNYPVLDVRAESSNIRLFLLVGTIWLQYSKHFHADIGT